MDHLEDEVKHFFSSAKRLKPETRDVEFSRIKTKYKSVLEDAEEKVNLAGQMYELVDRYLRRLDQELDKFKNELEADNAGITEVLERRSHELDQVPSHHSSTTNHVRKKIDPSYGSHGLSSGGSGMGSGSMSMSCGMSERMANGGSIGNSSAPITLYNANNAIAAAASQALVATTQMQSGRRTASLKASIDAIGMNSYPNFSSDTAFGQSSFGSYGNSLEAGSSRGKRNLNSFKVQLHQLFLVTSFFSLILATICLYSSSISIYELPSFRSLPLPLSPSLSLSFFALLSAPFPCRFSTHLYSPTFHYSTFLKGAWTFDPDEPTYCVCNQVSYGEMVACDNEDCEIEWFHYTCVGLTAAPKGKWYCPQCISKIKKRRVSERRD